MNRILLITILACLTTASPAKAQSSYNELVEEAMKYIKLDSLTQAENLFRQALKADPTEEGAIDLFDLLTDATLRVPSLAGARFAIYANRKVIGCLRKQQKNAKNVSLTLEQAAGRIVTRFDGIPIRTVDALTFTETALTGF